MQTPLFVAIRFGGDFSGCRGAVLFIVAASAIGIQVRVVAQATSAAFIAAGLLSALLFPLLALGPMPREKEAQPGEVAVVEAATAIL